MRYVTYATKTYFDYFNVDIPYRFGSDVSYSNGNYTLTGTTVDIKDWPHNYSNGITNAHYTCFNEEKSNSCGDKIYYVYWGGAADIWYIELFDGKKYNDALYEMINYKGNDLYKVDANINKYDSAIKQMIDHWYEHSELTNKTNYLQDVIYCNDRTILNNDLRNWEPNGIVTMGDTLYFKMYNTNTNTLTCTNEIDMFTMNNSKAKLKYPIGLLTENERSKMGNNYAKIGFSYYLSDPTRFYQATYYNHGTIRIAGTSGTKGDLRVYESSGVRPVITLSVDTEFISGDGGYDTPYLIE